MNAIRSSIAATGFLFAVVSAAALAQDAKDDAQERERRRFEGLWRVVSMVVDGNEVGEADVRKVTVINGVDGSWSLHSEGKEISQGTSTVDPSANPKTIDFAITLGEGQGNQYLGIYELGEYTRKICFGPPGDARPAEFASTAGSQRIFMTLERDRDDAVKRDRRRMEGTWQVAALELNGNQAQEADARKLKVVMGADGSWSLVAEEVEAAQGTSEIDPSKKIKTIDFTTTTGENKGKVSFGIYEIGDETLRFCVAPAGKERPTEFATTPGSELILLTFERKK